MYGFDYLTDEQRNRLLAQANRSSAPAGTVIIREGTPSPGVIIVLDGTVGLEKDHLGGRIPLNELQAGEVLGEVSYLLNGSATATVVAHTPVQMAVLPKERLDELVQADRDLAANLFRSWARVLADRLDRRTGDAVGVYWSWG